MCLTVGITQHFLWIPYPRVFPFSTKNIPNKTKKPKLPNTQEHAFTRVMEFFFVRYLFHKLLKQKSRLSCCSALWFWKSYLTLFHCVHKISTVTAFFPPHIVGEKRWVWALIPCLIISLMYFYYIVLLSSLSEHHRDHLEVRFNMSRWAVALPRKQFCIFELLWI